MRAGNLRNQRAHQDRLRSQIQKSQDEVEIMVLKPTLFACLIFIEEKLKLEMERIDSRMSLVTTGKEIVKQDSENLYSSVKQMENGFETPQNLVQSFHEEDEAALDEYR